MLILMPAVTGIYLVSVYHTNVLFILPSCKSLGLCGFNKLSFFDVIVLFGIFFLCILWIFIGLWMLRSIDGESITMRGTMLFFAKHESVRQIVLVSVHPIRKVATHLSIRWCGVKSLQLISLSSFGHNLLWTFFFMFIFYALSLTGCVIYMCIVHIIACSAPLFTLRLLWVDFV